MVRMTIVIIEDDESAINQITEYCSEAEIELGIEIKKISFKSVQEFKRKIKELQLDLMIVDLRFGESLEDRSGWNTVKEVLTEEIIPVIIYSAFSEEEPDELYRNSLIVRVNKGEEEIKKFQQTLMNFIRIKLKYNQEKERITREFKKLSLETLREIFGEGTIEGLNENTLAMMSVCRLATYLLNVPPRSEEKFPPESIFIYPPLEIDSYPKESLFLGDFLEKKGTTNSSSLWLVISPSCDLVFTNERKPKITEVLLLRCYGKYTEVPFLKNVESENGRKNALSSRLQRNTAKILKCPTLIFKSNYILILFKDYKTLPYDKIKNGIRDGSWRKLATLATPNAESLQSLFISDISRIGTPDTVTSDEERLWIKDFIKDNIS